MHAIEHITDRITLVVLSVTIWSGRKKLRPEDLKLGTEIPPEDLVSLGSKRVCNPEDLKVFHRLKKTAERLCLSVGTRFLGGFAVPRDQADRLAQQLETLKVAFDTETADFLSGYDQALEEWIATLPQWEEPIRRAIEPAALVRARLRFGFQLIQIAPADKPGTLEDEVRGLGDGVFGEVAQMAAELEASFEGKERLHRRALGTFRRIREKLACLSFVDLRIEPLVDTLDGWFERVPLDGPIAGPVFNEGMGLALLLADPERMARHGAGQWSVRQGLAPRESDAEEEANGSSPLADTETRALNAVQASVVDFDAELDALFGAEPAPAGGSKAQELPTQPEPKTEERADEAVLEVESFFF